MKQGQASDMGNFYDKIELADNTLRTVKPTAWQAWFSMVLFY
jgi:hypothetical protein